MPVVGPLLPHALHLGAAGLEVAKILLAQPRLLVHLDVLALEGRGPVGPLAVVRGGEGLQDALGGLARAAVGGGEEVEAVGGPEHGAEAAAGVAGLAPAQGGELYAMVGDGLVDFAVF